MPLFQYTGVRPSGHVTVDLIEAGDVLAAKTMLREQNVVVADIAPYKSNRLLALVTKDWSVGGKPKPQEVASLARSLAGFTRTDTNLQDALKHLADQTHRKAIGKVTKQLHADLGRGHTLSKAAEAQADTLGEVSAALIAAGETSGTLPRALTMLADILDQRAQIRRAVRGALMYPIIVLVFSTLLVSLMLVTIIPTLAGVYANLGANLPLPTRVLISASKFLRAEKFLVLALVAVAVAAVPRLFKHPAVRGRYDRFIVRLPVIGRLARAAATSRACRVLSAGYNASVNEVQTIHLAANVAGNAAVAAAFRDAADAVEAGYTLGAGLDGVPVIDDMLVSAVKNGEASGTVAQRLDQYATNAEDEFANAVEQIKSLIEPLTTVVIGGIILGVTLAIYLPLMNLSSIIDK